MEFEQFENLTEEQKVKLRECKTKEEFVALLEEEDIDLSDDMLEAIAGGGDASSNYCLYIPTYCDHTPCLAYYNWS